MSEMVNITGARPKQIALDGERRLWTARETAEALACSPQHVLRLAVTGAIPAINIAPPGAKQNMWRFRPESITRWVREREQRGKRV